MGGGSANLFTWCKVYRRSGFCVLLFHVKIFSWPKIPMKILKIDSTFTGLVIWNETTHPKKEWRTNSFLRSCMATTQLLVNYSHAKENWETL